MSRPFPEGIEVLVLNAAIDPEFKQLLLQRRTTAAEAIGLELTAAQATMLAAIPVAQLERVIARASSADFEKVGALPDSIGDIQGFLKMENEVCKGIRADRPKPKT